MTDGRAPVTQVRADLAGGPTWRGASVAAFAAAFSTLWAASSAAQPPAPPATPEVVTYHTRPGDNLYDIAGRYLRDPADWKALSKLNHVPAPRRLQTGTPILLPVELLRRDSQSARVIAASGPVEHAFREGPFTPLSVDAQLVEGDRIRTGHNGFVTLELVDGSHIGVPQDSLVSLHTLRKTVLTGANDSVIDLRKGEVDSEVTHSTKRDDRFQIRSPSAVAGVRGTRFRVSYADNATRTTSVEVLDGAVGVDAANRAPAPGAALRSSEQLVPQHYGSLTTDAGHVGAPVALLPAPELLDPTRLQAAQDVSFDMAAMPDARSWRVQIARDAGLLALIRDEHATQPHASFSDLPDGSYFVSISAIDSHGLEGIPHVYAFERRQFGLMASATQGTGARHYDFRWFVSRQAGTTHFRFVLGRTADLSHPLIDRTDLTGGELVVNDLPQGVYYWTVIAERFDEGKFYATASGVQSFTLAY